MSSKKTDIPLLLTGTIDSGVYSNVGNVIRDVSDRLSQYEHSIECYIKHSPFRRIVFIENSDFPFDEKKFEEMAVSYDKTFEFIRGSKCVEAVISRGKSFGDAFLIAEALDKSALLKHAECFYKISGRIYLKNAEQICRTGNKYRNEFVVYSFNSWCFTNIFKANVSDYLACLADSYQDCDEKNGYDIERCFYTRLLSSDLDVGSFHVYPYFEGIMGATGENYSGGAFERLIRNLMARLHFFTLGSPMSKLLGYIFGRV